MTIGEHDRSVGPNQELTLQDAVQIDNRQAGADDVIRLVVFAYHVQNLGFSPQHCMNRETIL